MSEGKTSRYLKYALGEVILVMIGIFAALQLNNWNESRKSQVYEIKMLKEIMAALDNDISNFENMAMRASHLDSSANHFIDMVYEKKTFIDSMYNKQSFRWYGLRTGIIYLYNRGPYEGLKSSGLDRISNDKLRNELVQLYDFEWPRHEDFFLYTDADYNPQVEQLESYLGPHFFEEVDSERMLFRKFPSDLLQKPDFLALLTEMRLRGSEEKGFINRFIPRLKEICGQIEAEINKAQ